MEIEAQTNQLTNDSRKMNLNKNYASGALEAPIVDIQSHSPK
jgi:hypothetical protein